MPYVAAQKANHSGACDKVQKFGTFGEKIFWTPSKFKSIFFILFCLNITGSTYVDQEKTTFESYSFQYLVFFTRWSTHGHTHLRANFNITCCHKNLYFGKKNELCHQKCQFSITTLVYLQVKTFYDTIWNFSPPKKYNWSFVTIAKKCTS